jgi:ubiquitin-protein ligase
MYILYMSLQDLLNFDDPLNVDAADHYSRNKVSFTIEYSPV